MVIGKKLLFIMFFMVVVILGAYYFQTNKVKSLQNVEMLPTDQQKPPIEWQTYANSRFGYSISYPPSWNPGKEADNQDGKALHKDDRNEVLVYGTLNPSNWLGKNDDFIEQKGIVLSDGRQATQVKFKDSGEDRMIYVVFFDDNGKQYTFFAKVSVEFFNENEQLLQEVVRSFKRIKGEEDQLDQDCDNYTEITKFKEPIPVVWDAKLDGCLSSCWGAYFTRVPDDPKYPRFSGYVPDNGDRIADEFMKTGQVLKIYGKWTDVSDSYGSVFDNKCVPTVEIEKIEIVK